MKAILVALITLVFCQNLMAGDAGYMSRTCMSASQRTVLTDFSDYTNGSYIYTLIIDGMPVVYDLSDARVTEQGDDGYITIYKDGMKAFSIQRPEKTITVYQDPRQGSIAMNNAGQTPLTISVTCKDYWPAP